MALNALSGAAENPIGASAATRRRCNLSLATSLARASGTVITHAFLPTLLLQADDDDFSLMCLRGIFEGQFSSSDDLQITEATSGQEIIEVSLAVLLRQA